VGDGTLGLADHSPYDAIVVAAAATRVPPALVEQLAESGRLVQPMGPGGNEIVAKFRKRGGRLVREGDVASARFVPLIAGPGGDLREPDFNLLVSTLPFRPGRARREVVARVRRLTGAVPSVGQLLGHGILAVRVAAEPRDVVQRLRTLCVRDPRALRSTRKWVPVDRWTRAELPAMREAVTRLRSRIGPNETWRMTLRTADGHHAIEPEPDHSLAGRADRRQGRSRPPGQGRAGAALR
jgi:hypothetical protein